MKNKFNPRKSKSLKRKINSRNTKKTFLILCEGEKTEPNYFKGFRVKTANIRVLGTGMNTESLVKECIKYKNSSEFSNKDEFWVVFDKDSFSNSLINKAFKLAGENNINIAYSNEAFEIWYLLHFNYYTTAISRTNYKELLSKLIKDKYQKNSIKMYDILLNKQEVAINNAKKLEENNGKDNPSTTVYKLVQELNKQI